MLRNASLAIDLFDVDLIDPDRSPGRGKAEKRATMGSGHDDARYRAVRRRDDVLDPVMKVRKAVRIATMMGLRPPGPRGGSGVEGV